MIENQNILRDLDKDIGEINLFRVSNGWLVETRLGHKAVFWDSGFLKEHLGILIDEIDKYARLKKEIEDAE